MAFITTKTILPGNSGTKKEFDKYGNKLICVRYKNDYINRRKVKTVELIIENKPWSENKGKRPINKKVYITVDYNEKHLRKIVSSTGGIWNKEKRLWEMIYGDVINLGLEDRLIENE